MNGWLREGMYKNLTIQTSDLPINIKDKIKDIQKQIPEDKFTDKEDEKGWVENGKQKLFHTTILYGIEEEDIGKIKSIVSRYKPIKVSTGTFDTFDKLEEEGYVALVLRVESEDLKKLHDELKDSVTNKDEYPEYKPHITIGYLKEKFEDLKEVKPVEFIIDDIEVCHKDGSREKIKLEAKMSGWLRKAEDGEDLNKRILEIVEEYVKNKGPEVPYLDIVTAVQTELGDAAAKQMKSLYLQIKEIVQKY